MEAIHKLIHYVRVCLTCVPSSFDKSITTDLYSVLSFLYINNMFNFVCDHEHQLKLGLVVS